MIEGFDDAVARATQGQRVLIVTDEDPAEVFRSNALSNLLERITSATPSPYVWRIEPMGRLHHDSGGLVVAARSGHVRRAVEGLEFHFAALPETLSQEERALALSRVRSLHHTLGGDVLRVGEMKKAPRSTGLIDRLRDFFQAW
jgi:hypothetical protein